MSIDHDTTSLLGTKLAPDQLLPDMAFTEADSGEEWRPSKLRQRSALVLCFMHADCAPCHAWASALAEHDDELQWSDAQVRVVLPTAADSPFPVLLDPDGEARARMLDADGQIPTVLVADRYSAVAESHPAADHDLPEPDEILRRLWLLACDCE